MNLSFTIVVGAAAGPAPQRRGVVLRMVLAKAGQEGEQDDITVTFAESLAAFGVGLNEATQKGLDQVLTAIAADSKAKAAAGNKNDQQPPDDILPSMFCRIFEGLQREAVGLAEVMSETDMKSHRSNLKTQSNWFKIKLNTHRSASEVQLNTQKREMEAAANRALELRLQSLPEGALLAEVQAEKTELMVKLETAMEASRASREEVKQCTKETKAAEARQLAAEGELARERAEVEAAKNALSECLSDLRGTKETNTTTLAEQVKATVAEMSESRRQVANLDKEQTLLIMKLAEAQSAAESVARAHAEECAHIRSESAEATEAAVVAARLEEQGTAAEGMSAMKASNAAVAAELRKVSFW